MNEENSGEIARISQDDACRRALQMLVEGVGAEDAHDELSRMLPSCDARSALAAASERLGQAADCDRRVVIGFGLEAFREIYRQAMERGQLGDAMKAVREMVALARATEAYVSGGKSDDDDANETGQ
jgi:hypothetical protein